MKKLIDEIDIQTFLAPAIMVLIVLTFGVVAPDKFGDIIMIAFTWITTHFGWFYALGTTALIFFCFWAGFSKVGKIRLGGKNAKPDMKMGSWIAITFTSGMALGVVFYGVGEGLMNYMTPPGFTGLEGGTAQAAEEALKYVFVHWCFQPYAIYTAAGLGFAFVYWNMNQKFSLSAGLYPLVGEKAYGWRGNIVNWLCLYVMVATLGTNVGLGTLQLTSGIDYVFDFSYDAVVMQMAVIITLAVISITAACTGIHKGIKYISVTNMYIFAAILIWAFCFGGTDFILANTVTSVGKYLDMFLPQALYLDPTGISTWISDWTIYYWAWWLTVAPLTGLFLAKLAKGRTIREFVLVNMFIPIGFVVVWFGTFGSSAIFQQMMGNDIWGQVEAFGFPVSLFAYLNTLPCKSILTLLGFLAIFFSFITQSESMTYTMAGMTAKDNSADETGEQKSPRFLKVFWGGSISLMGFILIQSGGLNAVQKSVVMLGLPILVVIIINCISFAKATTNRVKYDYTLSDEDREKLKLEADDAV
ncbi:BCCT family transporter [Bengtsoniella intestinalis]|uniref:BCCT family transporter n=1 Tax=Bengtsoniella intestinalis TaxID=3073143 RepID=UPI00391F9F20